MRRTLLSYDLWSNERSEIDASAPDPACEVCGKRNFRYLSGEGRPHITLCGRNSVQLSFPGRAAVSLDDLEAKLAAVGQVSRNKYLVRAAIGPYNVTVFPDGRAVIGGTEDIAEARSVYARYVGN